MYNTVKRVRIKNKSWESLYVLFTDNNELFFERNINMFYIADTTLYSL